MSLIVEHISFAYEGHKVLEDVSFQVSPGTFCALLGRNGSGKSTLLHLMAGLLRPARGHIKLAGRDLRGSSRSSIARRMALVLQEHARIFPFTVLDVVVMGRTPFMRLNQRPGPADYELALRALEELDAGHLAKRNFNRISGGERQIALLARGLLQSRENLLLDEPTNHLDFNNQHILLGRIKALCEKRGTRVVAAMHDPNLALAWADQVIMLSQGKVLAHGPAAETMTAEMVGRLYEADVRKIEFDGGGFFMPRPPGDNP